MQATLIKCSGLPRKKIKFLLGKRFVEKEKMREWGGEM